MTTTKFQHTPTIPVTVKLDQNLVNEIITLKSEYSAKGKYFSITGIIEAAIKNAVCEGRQQLNLINGSLTPYEAPST